MRQYIVIDFDDVIAETFPVFLENLNNYQTSVYQSAHVWETSHFKQWDAAFTTGFSEETIQRLFASINYDDVVPVRDAVLTIHDLVRGGHKVHVVTANPRHEDIRAWMDQNGLEEVMLTSKPDKVAFLRERGFTMIIDDNPNTLKAAAEEGFIAVRFERNWNKSMIWGRGHTEQAVGNWYGVWRLVKNLEDKVRDKMFEDVEEMSEWTYGPDAHGRLPAHPDYTKRNQLNNDKYVTPSGDPVTTNANGAKQTDLRARYDLLPALAVAEVAGVLNRGAEIYGEDNWRGLSVKEILNHVIGHAIAYLRTGSEEDLAHAATRGLMALEIHLGGGTDGE